MYGPHRPQPRRALSHAQSHVLFINTYFIGFNADPLRRGKSTGLISSQRPNVGNFTRTSERFSRVVFGSIRLIFVVRVLSKLSTSRGLLKPRDVAKYSDVISRRQVILLVQCSRSLRRTERVRRQQVPGGVREEPSAPRRGQDRGSASGLQEEADHNATVGRGGELVGIYLYLGVHLDEPDRKTHSEAAFTPTSRSDTAFFRFIYVYPDFCFILNGELLRVNSRCSCKR